MERVIQLLNQIPENVEKSQSKFSSNFLLKLKQKSQDREKNKQTEQIPLQKSNSSQPINDDLKSVPMSPDVNQQNSNNEFFIPVRQESFKEETELHIQTDKYSKQGSLLKQDDNPSAIQTDEMQEDFKVQNETVINILHNIDEGNKPKRKKTKFYIDKEERSFKNSVSQSTLNRLPEHALLFKQRQEKAKNQLYDKQAHQQAQQLILKLTRERRLQEEKKLIKFQQQTHEMSYSIENIKRQREEQEEIQKLSKRKEIVKKLEEGNIRRVLRKQLNYEQNKLVNVIKKEIVKDQVIIQLTEQEKLNQILEQRKKRVLAQKRELCRPFSLEEIKEHSRKHAEDIKVLKLERDQVKIERDLNHSKKVVNFPKTKFTIKVIKDDMQLRNSKVKTMEDKKNKRQRQVKYGEVVKDVFQPTVLARSMISKESEKQEILDLSTQNYYEFDEYVKVRKHAHEIKESTDQLKGQELIDHLKSAQFRGFLNSDDNLRKIQKALQQSRLMVSSSPVSPQPMPEIKSKSSSKKLSYKPYTGKYNYPKAMQNKDILLKESKSDRVKMPAIASENYLNELKQKRLLKEKTTNKKYETWQEVSNMKESSLQPIEKYRTVMSKVNQLESRAKQSEQLHREEEANKLYLDSIKAKLLLLEQIKSK